MNPSNAEIADRGDLDEAVRQVDRLTERGAWDELVDLRDRCHRAVDRGHQLWPAAALAEYRLALRAPGPLAAKVLGEARGLFTLGPLTEVATSTHTWAELESGLGAGPTPTVVAAERVVRGEALDALVGDPRLDPSLFGLPLALQAWEPRYPVAVYRDDEADFPTPVEPSFTAVGLPDGTGVEPVDDAQSEHALAELARPWSEQSNGRVRTAVVQGDRLDVVAASSEAPATGPVDLADLTPAEALAWMAWVGASGGAHGRRRGMATGRFNAWWAAAALAGFDDWPVAADDVGEAVGELRWARVRHPGPDAGWRFHLVVESPTEGLSWVLHATDHA